MVIAFLIIYLALAVSATWALQW